MKTKIIKQAAVVAVLTLAIFLLATDQPARASFEKQISNDDLAFDQSQEQTTPQQEKTAEQVYKNIQMFNGLPASRLMGAMSFFAKSLGVDCTHCHVQNEFEKDDKPAKQNARKMYRMIRLANKELNTSRVTCYTCHRGHAQPEPPPDLMKAQMDEMRKQAEQDKRPAEEVYKNIQSLKGVPAGRWMMIMTRFSKSLGVDCTYCHVEGAFEKDDKPAKQTARRMLRLTGTIYREIYNSQPSPINCYTCHRGQAQIVSVPTPPKTSQ
jgi:hypothetical protein